MFDNPAISTILQTLSKLKKNRLFSGFCHVDCFSGFVFRLFVCFPMESLLEWHKVTTLIKLPLYNQLNFKNYKNIKICSKTITT